MKKECIKTVKSITATLICGIFIGTMLVLLVFSIPGDRIKGNLRESAEVIEAEGVYYDIIPGINGSRLDNFTDSIMLSSAAYNENESIIDRAMKVYRIRYEDPLSQPTDALINYANGREDFAKTEYTRYWHGYMVILKPLLCFLNYKEIRIINMLFQLIIFAIVIYAMTIRHMAKYIFAYVFTCFCLMPVSVMMSLQYSGVWYIYHLAVLMLLFKYDYLMERKKMLVFFVIIGMCTSYIDLLTYPLVTFGIPIIFYYLLNEEENFTKSLLDSIKLGTSWAIGYLGMWSGKWMVASLLLRENAVGSAIDTAKFRTSNQTSDLEFSRWEAIERNISVLSQAKILQIGALVVITLTISLLLVSIRQRKRVELTGYCFLIVAVSPFVWYFVASNHSYIHFWFTFRTLSVTVFAMLSWLIKNINLNKYSL